MISPIDGRPVGTVREADAAIAAAAMAAAAAGFSAWAATPAGERAAALERAAELLEAHRGELARAVAERRRQDARRCARRSCARRSIIAAITPRRRAARSRAQPMPGPTGESNVLALSRPRRLRLHQSVEFSARDLSRPGHAPRSPPAMPWSPSPPSRRRSSPRAPSRCCTKPAFRRRALHLVPGDGKVGAQPGRRSARRRRRLHRLDRSRPRHQPRARRQRADRSCR